MKKGNQNIKQLEKVKMKGLKIPSIFVSYTGWLHARQNKVVKKDGEASSNWLERKQKDFNAYSAVMLKITGRILVPLEKELAITKGIQDDNKFKLLAMEEQILSINPVTAEEKRRKAALKKSILEVKEQFDKNEEKIKELEWTISELEHESLQLLQKTRQQAETKMLTYLQGAKVIVDKIELLKEARKETELYVQYCKYEDKFIEREVE